MKKFLKFAIGAGIVIILLYSFFYLLYQLKDLLIQ